MVMIDILLSRAHWARLIAYIRENLGIKSVNSRGSHKTKIDAKGELHTIVNVLV